MKKSSKQEYIDYRINSARETFEAAKTLAKDKHWNSVINRLYYVCFYAILPCYINMMSMPVLIPDKNINSPHIL